MNAMPSSQSQPAPESVRLSRRTRSLTLSWPGGETTVLDSLTLRRHCACSSCEQNRRSGRISLLDAELNIEKVELFGVSGLQLFFTDGHSRGVYPWGYLKSIGTAN